jgi:hypothetical protein
MGGGMGGVHSADKKMQIIIWAIVVFV